jgi:hypothetical protein
MLFVIMSMGRDYVSVLRPHLFMPQTICDHGKPRWNDIDRKKRTTRKENLSHCHSVHHKSHTDWPGPNPVFRGERPATNRLCHGTATLRPYFISYFKLCSSALKFSSTIYLYFHRFYFKIFIKLYNFNLLFGWLSLINSSISEELDVMNYSRNLTVY